MRAFIRMLIRRYVDDSSRPLVSVVNEQPRCVFHVGTGGGRKTDKSTRLYLNGGAEHFSVSTVSNVGPGDAFNLLKTGAPLRKRHHNPVAPQFHDGIDNALVPERIGIPGDLQVELIVLDAG